MELLLQPSVTSYGLFQRPLFQADISNQTHMSTLEDRLQSLPDVVGIVHTAMVLRDEFIKDLTLKGFNEVMGPKIKGKTA